MIAKNVGVISTIGYIVFGLGLSAVGGASALSLGFAVLGLICWAASRHNSSQSMRLLAIVGLSICITWLWADHSDLGVLYWQLIATAGSFLIIAGIQLKWYRVEDLLYLLLVPFILNLTAYILSINYVEALYDIDPELAFLRFGGFVGHPSALTTRLIAPLAILIVLKSIDFKFNSFINEIIIVSLSLLSALFAVYATGSKKALVLTLILLLLLFVLNISRAITQWRFVGIGQRMSYVFIFSGLSLLLLFALPTVDFQSMEVFRRAENAFFGGDESTEDRLSLLSPVWSLFVEAPVFGYGLDEYQYVSGVGYYSHNNAVELLITGGVVLSGLYYFVMLKAFVNFIFRYKKIAASLLLGSFFFMLDVTGVTYSDRGGWLIVSFFVYVSLNESKYRRK